MTINTIVESILYAWRTKLKILLQSLGLLSLTWTLITFAIKVNPSQLILQSAQSTNESTCANLLEYKAECARNPPTGSLWLTGAIFEVTTLFGWVTTLLVFHSFVHDLLLFQYGNS